MAIFKSWTCFAAVQLLLVALFLSSSTVDAVPRPQAAPSITSTDYWMSSITRQGTVAYGNDPNFKIYRNVKDYGATGMYSEAKVARPAHINHCQAMAPPTIPMQSTRQSLTATAVCRAAIRQPPCPLSSTSHLAPTWSVVQSCSSTTRK